MKINDKYEEKRQAALKYLGDKWVLHPNYKFISRHSPFGDTTQKMRAA